jgi:outer membrane murein-binding lipoprotein Lpp
MGLLVGLLLGVAGVAVGWVAGGASSAQNVRQKSKGDAQELSAKVDEAKGKIKTLSEKIEAGRNQLLKERKYPTALAKDLGAINVDFDGSQLAGRRFSGFSTATTQQLVEFIQSVQALNDRKLLVQGLLTRLEKPISEQLSGTGAQSVTLILVGTKDGSGFLAPLKDPIAIQGGNVNLPAKFVFSDNGSNTEISRYNGGDIGKGEGFAVTPASFNKVCPSETQGQMAQLGAQLGGILRDIQGEKAGAGADVVTEEKPGLLDRADQLASALRKVE